MAAIIPRLTVLTCVMSLAACGAEAAPTPLVQNPMLEVWCGEHPCQWTTRGDTKRVGTWHPDDYAIELSGAGSAVTQVNPTVNEQKSRCFSFSLTADIGEDARVWLELDFLDDGKVEFSSEIPKLQWGRKTFDITPPTWYQGVRFIIRNEGPGRAVVAQLEVVNNGFNCSAPPIPLWARPAGARCENDEDCAIQRCTGFACGGGCKTASECAAGEVCGRVLGRNTTVDACTPRGSLRFGAVCSLDEQCESAACGDGICSECVPASTCRDGTRCERSKLAPTNGSTSGLPFQCGPGVRDRGAGELCTTGTDCESGYCDGVSVNCAVSGCISQQSSCSSQCIQSLVVPGMCR